MHRRKQTTLLLLAVVLDVALASDRWVWSRNRPAHAHDDYDIDGGVLSPLNRNDRRSHAHVKREREPTTRRPSLGQPANDEIEDYPESQNMNDDPRRFPYGGNGYFGGGDGGVGNGFGIYPGGGYGGNPANGILVGPEGPTGVIGRPQQYYPGGAGGVGGGGYPQGIGGGLYGQGQGVGFPAQSGFGGGIPGQTGAFGSPNGFPGSFPGQVQLPQEAALNPAYGGQYPGGQYGGQSFPAGSQYPGAQFAGNPQFPGAQQYPGGQFPGSQYPSAAGGGGVPSYAGPQYPGSGPKYTEGYGLAYPNSYNPNNGFNPLSGYPGNSGYVLGFDKYDNSKEKLNVEGKSASIESRNAPEKKVDDKVSKNFTKT